jgi:hypothetical protein
MKKENFSRDGYNFDSDLTPKNFFSKPDSDSDSENLRFVDSDSDSVGFRSTPQVSTEESEIG